MMKQYPYFDAHCDTLYQCELHGRDIWRNEGHLDLERLSAYAPMGQVFALWTDSEGKTAQECYATVVVQEKIWRRAKELYPELLKNCCLSLEGAELIGCDEERLPMLKEWGVRWINLTWNHETALGFPHTVDRGLTEKGRAFAKRVYELGMYVDISHLSERGVWDLAETVSGPIVASHCNSRALQGHSRNITDEVAREIIARKGLIGLNFYHGFISDEPVVGALADHVEHFLTLGGEDCLCLGGDCDGTEWLMKDITGVQDIPLLWEELSRRGHSDALIGKIAYGNLAAFLAVE